MLALLHFFLFDFFFYLRQWNEILFSYTCVHRCASSFVVRYFGPSGWYFTDPDFKIACILRKSVQKLARYFYFYKFMYIYISHYAIINCVQCIFAPIALRFVVWYFHFFTFMYRFIFILARFSLFGCVFVCLLKSIYSFFLLSFHFNPISFDYFFFSCVFFRWNCGCKLLQFFSVVLVLWMRAYR